MIDSDFRERERERSWPTTTTNNSYSPAANPNSEPRHRFGVKRRRCCPLERHQSSSHLTLACMCCAGGVAAPASRFREGVYAPSKATLLKICTTRHHRRCCYWEEGVGHRRRRLLYNPTGGCGDLAARRRRSRS